MSLGNSLLAFCIGPPFLVMNLDHRVQDLHDGIMPRCVGIIMNLL